MTDLCRCNQIMKASFPGKVRAEINGFTRIITFSPGFICDLWKQNPSDGRNHGKSCPDILFILKNEKGAIQFRLMTGWYLEGDYFKPMPSDLGYHSPIPQYEDQTLMSEECPWLDDKPCYYDGSTLDADEPFRVLIEKGEEALWTYLEEIHHARFQREEGKCS